MRNRIHENITRRQMKQLLIMIKPETHEVFKLYCESKGISMNQVLEQYITEVSKEYVRKLPQKVKNYSEAVSIVKELIQELGLGNSR